MMDWDANNQEQPPPPQPHHQNQENHRANVAVTVNGNPGGGGVMYLKVMTDEQLETLRKQIAVYATICEQLVEMHKALTAQQDLTGGKLGNLYCDPLMALSSHKITARQRWTPTPVQLQILERIFDRGNGTPSKQKIKEITSELIQHGQISEMNVYNWFQNRRARSKRKQPIGPSNNAESEVETEVDSQNDKETKPDIFHSQQNQSLQAEDLCFHSPEMSSELHYFGNDHLTGKMGTPGSYNLYEQAENYSM